MFKNILIVIKIDLCVKRYIFSFLLYVVSLLLCVARFLCNVRQCAFLFTWDSSYHLKRESIISACFIRLYVWVGVYVCFPYLVMLWLYVGLWVFAVFSCTFLFFQWPVLEYIFLLALGV
jgi:hypothetical protein